MYPFVAEAASCEALIDRSFWVGILVGFSTASVAAMWLVDLMIRRGKLVPGYEKGPRQGYGR